MFVIVMAFLSVPFIIIWFMVLTASSEIGKVFALLCLLPFFGGCLLTYFWRKVNLFYMCIAVKETNTVTGVHDLIENHAEITEN